MRGALVRLVPVDSENWRALAQVACARGQERFVAPVTYYLCLCNYGGQWQPWAIVADGAVVGHAMWARRVGVHRTVHLGRR
jgi:diamine N-acetyltransferase